MDTSSPSSGPPDSSEPAVLLCLFLNKGYDHAIKFTLDTILHVGKGKEKWEGLLLNYKIGMPGVSTHTQANSIPAGLHCLENFRLTTWNDISRGQFFVESTTP